MHFYLRPTRATCAGNIDGRNTAIGKQFGTAFRDAPADFLGNDGYFELLANFFYFVHKTFEVYKSVHERVPSPDPKVMGVALKQLAASVPQAAQLKIDDFIDRSLISELESEGFISKVYEGR